MYAMVRNIRSEVMKRKEGKNIHGESRYTLTCLVEVLSRDPTLAPPYMEIPDWCHNVEVSPQHVLRRRIQATYRQAMHLHVSRPKASYFCSQLEKIILSRCQQRMSSTSNAAAPGYHTFWILELQTELEHAPTKFLRIGEAPLRRVVTHSGLREDVITEQDSVLFEDILIFLLFPDAASARLLLDEFMVLQHARCRYATGKKYYDSDVRHKRLFTRCISECIEDMNGALSH